MAESIGSQVIGAVVNLLTATGYPAYRTRLEGFSKDQCPAYNVMPAETVPTYVVAGEQQNTLRVLVHCIAIAPAEVDLQIDPLFVAAHLAIQQDITLGGLVQAMRLKSWGFKTDAKAEQDLGLLELQYEAEYSTVRGDPTAPVA